MLYPLILYVDKSKDLVETAKQYRDGKIVIDNTRDEAAEIFTELRNTLMNSWTKDLADQVNITASIFNNLTLQRRCMFVCLFNALT